MRHSRVTSKGQTTSPGKIRKALRIKPYDKLEYLVEGDHVTIRVHPGTRSLKGALASKKGKGCPSHKSARLRLKLPVGTTAGEQTKAGRHQSDCSLSRTGSRKACQWPISRDDCRQRSAETD
jgi:bifunctional DNA-binding transcriptional regulator/antitoxin component of YhaV-PrlF toxin-antitoxin module